MNLLHFHRQSVWGSLVIKKSWSKICDTDTKNSKMCNVHTYVYNKH